LILKTIKAPTKKTVKEVSLHMSGWMG